MKFTHLVHSSEPGALQMCVCVCVHACLVAQLCLSLYDRMDCSPPGSLSIAFSRQHWSGLPSPPPGGLPDPGIEPASLLLPALAGGYFTTVPPGRQALRKCLWERQRGGQHDRQDAWRAYVQKSPLSCLFRGHLFQEVFLTAGPAQL